MNKRTIVIGSAVVAAVVVYGATRTERGSHVRRQVANKVSLPKAGRIVKGATQAGVERAQELLGKDTRSAGYKAATDTK